MPALTDKQIAKPLVYCNRSIIAWQQGAKFLTRRLAKPQPLNPRWYLRQQEYDGRWAWWTRLRDGRGCWAANVRQPYAVDDLLWLRETLTERRGKIVYFADATYAVVDGASIMWRWKKRNKLSAMFMPRFACRYYAKVIDVRPEPLQDITDEDVIAEGTLVGMGDGSVTRYLGQYQDWYAEWWSDLHHKPGTSWHSNPIIWRYALQPVDIPK